MWVGIIGGASVVLTLAVFLEIEFVFPRQGRLRLWPDEQLISVRKI